MLNDRPGNIETDPMFIGPDGPDDDAATAGDNDFRLRPQRARVTRRPVHWPGTA